MSNEYTELEYELMHEGDMLRQKYLAVWNALNVCETALKALLAQPPGFQAREKGARALYQLHRARRRSAGLQSAHYRRYSNS